MAELIVDYHLCPDQLHLLPGEELHLDREFLSAGRDETLTRAASAPKIVHMADRWWLHNGDDGKTKLTVYLGGDGRRFTVEARCAFPLPDGECEVYVADPKYRVRLVVSGSPAERPTVQSGPETLIGLHGAAVRVQLLLRGKPRHRTVLAAHYREYFTPGIASPAPQDRMQTRRCMGLHSFTAIERALNEVSESIWGEISGHRHELAEYLIRERLLVADDQKLVPHRHCGHDRAHPIR